MRRRARLDERFLGPIRRSPGGRVGQSALNLRGVTPDGREAEVALESSAGLRVLAFVTSACVTCTWLWQSAAFPPLPSSVALILVTVDPSMDSPKDVAARTPPDAVVIMSSQAWQDYEVPGATWFVAISDGQVIGEGAASSWDELNALLKGWT